MQAVTFWWLRSDVTDPSVCLPLFRKYQKLKTKQFGSEDAADPVLI
jgi:hypothetical protein